MFKSYIEVRDWLESFIPLVYGKEELGLSRIENLLKKLGNPEKKFKSIHVGGTSGKGSTAYYIARLLQYSKSEIRNLKSETNSKYKSSKIQNRKNFLNFDIRVSNLKPIKIGLHVSPHLNYIGERMQINGKNISVKRLVGLVNKIKPVVDDIKSEQPQITPSYFEILVALSFLYFAKEKVDFAIVEVGLGGRLDATNVLSPKVSVITNIGLDHTEILGDTLEKIAEEKAGIIKPYVPVVTAALGNSLKVIEKAARLASAPLIILKSESKRAKAKDARLINIYTQDIENQQNNDVLRYVTKSNDIDSHIPYYVNLECALLAISAVLELKIPLSVGVIKNAFSAQFAGRFEEIEQGVILDGAHNADKIKTLINFVRSSKFEIRNSKQIQKSPTLLKLRRASKIQNPKSVILVVAFKTGKDWKKMLDILIKKLPVKTVIATEYQAVTDTGKGSAVPADEIAKYVDDRQSLSVNRFKMIDVRVINNSQEAIFRSLTSKTYHPESTILLITGSLYLVGEARTLWKLPEF